MRVASRSVVVLALMVTVAACKSKPSAPPPTPAPSASAPSAEEPFKPAHPAHVNQSDGKGGFLPALPPPLLAAVNEIERIIFDAPPSTTPLPAPKVGPGHCGELNLGNGQTVYLDCAQADYATVKSAATPTVSHAELAGAAPRKLPAQVDHRKDGTEGPMLDQHTTSACTSFSLIAAVNHAVSRYLGHPGALSPMHAWARYHTPNMGLADQVNVGHGLTDLTTAPFDPTLANAWQDHKAAVDPAFLKRADGAAVAQIVNITRLGTGNLDEIKSALASGQDVWFGLRAAQGLDQPKKDARGESIVSDFDGRSSPASMQAGHAILLAGYQDSPHGTYYLIHNSWGTAWGTGGYAWIWEKTLKANIADAYVVEAHPAPGATVKVAPAVHKLMACRAGLSPDATTSQCVPRCADGGPRVNGVCPIAGQCPAGQVNLDGTCRLAAPVAQRTLPSGIAVHCGTSGCAYFYPNASNGCTAASGCAVSCAAPRYRLANGPRGFVCTG